MKYASSPLSRSFRQLPRWLRLATPFLLLPGIVLGGLSLAIGPRLWETLYASYQFCHAHLMMLSPGQAALSLLGVLASTALLGGVVGASREVRRLRRLSSTLAEPTTGAQAATVLDRQVLLVDDQEPLAFCHGLLWPRVYLSTGLLRVLSPRELEAVVRHEEVHVRQRDPLRLFVLQVLTATFFVMPLARTLRDRYRVWLEVRADYEAVKQVGREPLAGALLKLLQPSAQRAFSGAVSAFNPTEERVRRLLDPSPQPRIPLVPMPALLANAVLLANVGLLGTAAVSGANSLLAAASVCPIPIA